ncbi:MAG: hypothetical protein K2Q20_13650 [Phycisphaerales bacterium]|nr:hypothetical protein [Phycisphaerales bacterium]
MDLSDPWSLFVGLLLGLIGMGLLMYGKKAASPKAIVGGLVLCVVPYFVASVVVMGLCGAGVLGGW